MNSGLQKKREETTPKNKNPRTLCHQKEEPRKRRNKRIKPDRKKRPHQKKRRHSNTIKKEHQYERTENREQRQNKKNNPCRKSGHNVTKEPNAEQPATIRQQDATDKSPHREKIEEQTTKNATAETRKQQKPHHIRQCQTQRRKNRYDSNRITITTTPHTVIQTTKRSIVTPTGSTTNKTR